MGPAGPRIYRQLVALAGCQNSLAHYSRRACWHRRPIRPLLRKKLFTDIVPHLPARSLSSGLVGLVRKDSLLGGPAAPAFLPADFFDPGAFRRRRVFSQRLD